MKVKKVFCGIVICVLCMNMMNIKFGAQVQAKEEDSSFAVPYAKEKPIVDGKVDEIWNSTEPLYATYGQVEGRAYGYAKVLWSEDLIYLMASISDTTLSLEQMGSLGEGVMFMVSGNAEASCTPTWYCHANPAGRIMTDYVEQDLFGEAQCVIDVGDDNYIIEVALPLKEGKKYSVEECIGFNFFVLDDINADYSRDNICSWKEYKAEIWQQNVVDNLPLIKFVTENKNEQSTSFVTLWVLLFAIVCGVCFFILWRRRIVKTMHKRGGKNHVKKY